MRRMYSVVAALGGLSLTMGGTAALAANCGGMYLPACPVFIAPPPPPVVVECTHYVTVGCQTPVKIKPSAPKQIDPMVVSTSQPMDHLRRFSFKGAPHVNIMRVYGEREVAELGDAPAAFTGGCTPGSTQYCRSSDIEPPVMPAGGYAGPQAQTAQKPYIAPPAPQTQAPTARTPQMQYRSMAPQAAAPQQNWGRVSGPTMIGNMPATQVVCRQPNAPVPPTVNIATLPPVCAGPMVMPHSYGTGLGWAGGPVARRYGSYN